jgi:Protein of unknown function (DUF1592)/Protein of unknown function (DUF1588)/Protein of unknown function (DUF1595)/Protein of unknown function (DUF1587)
MRATGLGLLLIAAGCSGAIGDNPSGAGTDNGTGPGIIGGPGNQGGGPGGPAAEVPSPRLLRQLTLSEYRNTVGDLLQISNPDTTNIPADVPVRGFTTNAASAFIDQSNVDRYQSVGDALADRAVAESFTKLVPCQTQDTACAGKFIETFGLRAFRRPISPDEKTRYLALFDPTLTGGDFPTGVGLVIKTMLISPYFLMRSELGEQMSNGQAVLTPYEIATALSYGYTGSMPDDVLFAAAQSGALANKSEIEKQARRLLASDRGRARIAAFAGEWMEDSRAFVATKDPMTFPALKDTATAAAIVDAMKAESDTFFTNVAFDGTKKWDELFSANYTFANDRLAAFYGLPMPGSPDKAVKVALPTGSPRGGLLTLGMFLFGHARADQSSPTQRGHVIRANIFCSDVAPPPPGVDATVKPGTPGNTGREQIQALTGSGICNACHSLMNPIGFGLEGFDGAAMVRTLDHGEMVDTSGVINGLFPQPVNFNGPRELSSIIAGDKDAQSCLAKAYHRYVRGFDPLQTGVDADANAVELLGHDFASGNLDIPEMFVRVALQGSFTVRRSVEALNR